MSTASSVCSRTEYTNEQRKSLEELFNSGVRGKKSPGGASAIAKVASEIGLLPAQVQGWLYTKARAFKAGHPRKQAAQVRPSNGYNLWIAQKTEGKPHSRQALTDAAMQWKQLSEEEKQQYNTKAKEGFMGKVDGEVERKAKINYFGRKLKSIYTSLEGLGVEVLVVTMDKVTQNLSYDGTPLARSFMSDPTTLDKFITCVGGQDNCTDKGSRRLKAVDDVRALFRRLYGNALRKPKVRVPYAAVARGEVRIEGLPEGIAFADPKSYSLDVLDRLLEASDMRFEDQVGKDAQSVETELPAASNGVGIEITLLENVMKTTDGTGQDTLDQGLTPVQEKTETGIATEPCIGLDPPILQDPQERQSGSKRKGKGKRKAKKDKDAEYAVEEVKRFRAEDELFLVRWAGYGTDEETWEPASNLPGAVVMNFFKQ